MNVEEIKSNYLKHDCGSIMGGESHITKDHSAASKEGRLGIGSYPHS
jgi:hypothetical protein